MSSSPQRRVRRRISHDTPAVAPALALTLTAMAAAALAGAPLGAQGTGMGSRMAHAGSGDHAAHADLHGPQPVDAAVELIALTTMERLESDAGALCRAAELALTAGLLSDDEADRLEWFRRGQHYARQARELRPGGADPLFLEAAAIGLMAPHEPIRDRIRLADRVLEFTEEILERDPDHAGGLHLRGQLGATAMRLNPMIRFTAQKLMGSNALGRASWESAESDFRRAIAAEPDNAAHRIELALLLADTDRVAEARAELRRVIASGDGSGRALAAYHRERARELLREMR